MYLNENINTKMKEEFDSIDSQKKALLLYEKYGQEVIQLKDNKLIETILNYFMNNPYIDVSKTLNNEDIQRLLGEKTFNQLLDKLKNSDNNDFYVG